MATLKASRSKRPVVVAAIDVGSNAMRMAIAELSPSHDLTLLHTVREPVRLGNDVFTHKAISEETTELAIQAFLGFRDAMKTHHALRYKAVATSAVREASNRDVFIERVAEATGLDLTCVGGEEEARLVFRAVSGSIDLRGKTAVLIDIGGGSVEIVLVWNGQMVAAESVKMGTVRLLQLLQDSNVTVHEFHMLVAEYAHTTRNWLRQKIGSSHVDMCIATGGNVEALGDLRKRMLGKESGAFITLDELDEVVTRLEGMSLTDRTVKLKLRPNRADVIVPASIVLQKIAEQLGVGEILIPGVGLKDGVLLDLRDELFADPRSRLHYDQVLESAMLLGRKYQFEESHAVKVARLATILFDRTESLHHLGEEYRLLLEVAALLHDVGRYINNSEHHKHSQYLINATPMIGLTDDQRGIVANVARYHRKSVPNLNHEAFRVLSPRDRVVVSKLASILRIADSLDAEHGGKVTDITAILSRPKLTLKLEGEGDLLLERWVLDRRSKMFEDVLGVKVCLID